MPLRVGLLIQAKPRTVSKTVATAPVAMRTKKTTIVKSQMKREIK